ncbi:MAG: hypothetical protein H8E29_16910 [Anaerolineales bacterium]|uniref:Uncharacterized protein n=1 Tax=Candidatus Desulfolinea nitratireducens TaxID=2841698 RepID=A0A8J6NIG2_9CHLR|nr:hypothetical protein [Candidatus Desulfolinea nitratireducens]
MSKSTSFNLLSTFQKAGLRRGSMFGLILLSALLAFEIFNFSTTDFALTDLLGNELKFIGVRWTTILAFAFCGIDFAGVARLFTPEQGAAEPAEVWYLFGAWLLAAVMNAMLTWWGVSVAILDHSAQGSVLVSQSAMTKAIPIFVALMVWLVRVLIIGTFSMAGERLFNMDAVVGTKPSLSNQIQRPTTRAPARATPRSSARSAPRVASTSRRGTRSDPSYHPVGISASPNSEDTERWL